MSLSRAFSEFAPQIGLSRGAGICLGEVVLSAVPLCADDLVTATQLSRANVSVALSELRAAGLLLTAPAPGRKQFFTAPDPEALVRKVLVWRQRQVIAPFLDRLAELATPEAPTLTALHASVAQIAKQLGRLATHQPAAQATPDPQAERPRKKRKK